MTVLWRRIPEFRENGVLRDHFSKGRLSTIAVIS